MTDAKPEASIGELLSALARDTGVLLRQEVRLASTEMSIKAQSVGRNVGLIAMGGSLALAGLLALLTAAIAALATVLPIWLAALSVGVVVIAAGYGIIRKGQSGLKQIDPVPDQTVDSLRADVAWAKEQVR